MAKKRKRPPVQPLLGSQAFGDGDGTPVGSEAFGGSDQDDPLRGALVFGNDPEGKPRGSGAVGSADPEYPLRGALLVGNDPDGKPRGAGAFGGAEPDSPLRGALLFGNDPKGMPRGALAFGNPTSMQVQFMGASAFGAPQLSRQKLHRDDIGYDFGAVILRTDETTFAGIRRDPKDRLRLRVLKCLERRLECDVDALRKGLNENSIKWGRLRHNKALDMSLAEALRAAYRRAPGEVLGIGHVRDLLEEMELLHSFTLTCSWDRSPVTLTVSWDGETVAYAETRHHKEHTYFEFKNQEGEVLAYADTLSPGQGAQTARVRGIDGSTVCRLRLVNPVIEAEVEEGETETPKTGGRALLELVIDGPDGQPWLQLKEQRASPKIFKASLLEVGSEEPRGGIDDKLGDGVIESRVELDDKAPRVLAWALAAVMADLARLRRGGWPLQQATSEEEVVESVRDALGPPRSEE